MKVATCRVFNNFLNVKINLLKFLYHLIHCFTSSLCIAELQDQAAIIPFSTTGGSGSNWTDCNSSSSSSCNPSIDTWVSSWKIGVRKLHLHINRAKPYKVIYKIKVSLVPHYRSRALSAGVANFCLQDMVYSSFLLNFTDADLQCNWIGLTWQLKFVTLTDGCNTLKLLRYFYILFFINHHTEPSFINHHTE